MDRKTSIYVALCLTLAACNRSDDSGLLSASLESRPARLLLTGAVIQRLQQRAAANDPSWLTLKSRCDQMSSGTMYPPNGVAYADLPNVGPGYQGEEYAPAIRNIALCYRVVRGVDSSLESKYGAAGARLLSAMSTPPSSDGQQPSTDSGYGIRHFGVGMAIGFDWLYPALSADLKTRVITSLNLWIDWYDTSGFIHNDPIGNYFAGYLTAKTMAAIATEGDNAKAGTYWQDVQNRMWPQLVLPAYQKSMKGGGWPEGWGYGPLAVRNMVEFLFAVKTGKGLDWGSQIPQAREQAAYQRYFGWPSLAHMDDQGTVHSGGELRPSSSLAWALAMILEYSGDPSAAMARSFAADVLATSGAPLARDAWLKFLYIDDTLSKAAYTSQPLSYFAAGPGHVAMRSSWNRDAVWGAFSSGAYIDATYAGEQLYNEGSLAIVQGDQPVLINATGWLPQKVGNAAETFVFDDSYGTKTRRLFNTFFVNDSTNNIYNPGQAARTPSVSRTHVERYEDRGGFVRARGANIEDMYWGQSSSKPVQQFMRDLVYVRPNVFVLYDRTTVTAGNSDQWLAFHTPGQPVGVSVSDGSQRRYDIRPGGTTVGSVRTLLPRSANVQAVSLLSGAAYRLEMHTPAPAATGDWLTVVTAGANVPEQTRLSSADGNVLSGAMVGVNLLGARNQVVLFASDHLGQSAPNAVKYLVRQSADADHMLIDLAPSSTGYAVTVSSGSNGLTIDVHTGGPYVLSTTGTLSFTVSQAGAVSPTTWVAPPSGSSPPPPPVGSPPPPPPDGGTTAPPPPPPPSGKVTVSLQQGVASYSGTRDVSISSRYYDGWEFRGQFAKADPVLTAGTPGEYTKKTLLWFDLTSIPPNAHVISASLQLMVESWQPNSLRGGYFSNVWDYSALQLGWAKRSNTQNWSQPGVGPGDLIPGKSFTVPLNSTGYQLSSGALDPAQVQQWIQNPALNQGMLLEDPIAGVLLRVNSSENTTVSTRPKLTITYDLP